MTTFKLSGKYKIVILGEVNGKVIYDLVGKTALMTRYIYGTFCTDYDATVGIDFLTKSVLLEEEIIRMQIWDTAGQEKFRSLIPGYIRDSSIAIIAYDITGGVFQYKDRKSFEELPHWVQMVKKEGNIVIFVVANKTDLNNIRQVTEEEGRKAANEHDGHFIECSAKNGDGIELLFQEIAKKLTKTTPINFEMNNSTCVELQPVPVPTWKSCKCKC